MNGKRKESQKGKSDKQRHREGRRSKTAHASLLAASLSLISNLSAGSKISGHLNPQLLRTSKSGWRPDPRRFVPLRQCSPGNPGSILPGRAQAHRRAHQLSSRHPPCLYGEHHTFKRSVSIVNRSLDVFAALLHHVPHPTGSRNPGGTLGSNKSSIASTGRAMPGFRPQVEDLWPRLRVASCIP